MTRCPESLGRHSPPSHSGRCTWCGGKATDDPPPNKPAYPPMSDLTEAYEEFYDSDYGALDHDQIRDRYQMGQEK